MECKNVNHFEALLVKLDPMTIDEILANIRVAPNGMYCFQLPKPKNAQEQEAMDTFRKHLENIEYIPQVGGDPETFPKAFPFLSN